MTDESDKSESKTTFDLAERTVTYGKAAIRFVRKLPMDAVSAPLIRQYVRSATSLGANYGEADEAGSKKEFRYRISLCCRESRECKHWIQMLSVACPDCKEDARPLWQEANELCRIFAAIHRNSKPT